MKIVQNPARIAAIRMAMLIVSVVALDGTVVFFAPKPLFWAASIPGLIPLLTPFVIFSFCAPGKNGIEL